MNESIMKRTEELTKRDQKSLIEKALKTAEEVGELSQAVLVGAGSHGTQYRNPEEYNVLEEAVDVALCGLAAAFEAGFTTKEIEEMSQHKLDKWAWALEQADKEQNGNKH
jgi:NTP pyrophosphatase (non-canonical NTP hydrolase)